ncbi:MAG: FAD-dependent oxidoreductase [Actinomycetota bacterium]|nr:FAD-dependent oxidoreductase [Actinomycetota bacterium]
MAARAYEYIIIGGGLAGASAVAGIRELDKNGPVLLAGAEQHLPYDRPPLTKKLWFGKKKVEDIFIKDRKYYDDNGVVLLTGRKIVSMNAREKTVMDEKGESHLYKKLLIATGGIPRRLSIPGGELEGVCYFRTLDDYLSTRQKSVQGASATVIGGGFIGSEIAAALSVNGVNVTMLFPGDYIVDRVFPDYLGNAVQQEFMNRGVNIINRDTPASIERKGKSFAVRTGKGRLINSEIVIAGIGITPEAGLAESASLGIENGIVVNEYLETSSPGIYAAGDIANFPYTALGKRVRLEHWDNALNQGKQAGRNMAGAHERYDYMPYFFSDLFEFGYEAVGDVDARLETYADWTKENETGTVYYLEDGRVRGAMMCGIWEKVGQARELIKKAEHVDRLSLSGAIR